MQSSGRRVRPYVVSGHTAASSGEATAALAQPASSVLLQARCHPSCGPARALEAGTVPQSCHTPIGLGLSPPSACPCASGWPFALLLPPDVSPSRCGLQACPSTPGKAGAPHLVVPAPQWPWGSGVSGISLGHTSCSTHRDSLGRGPPVLQRRKWMPREPAWDCAAGEGPARPQRTAGEMPLRTLA